MRTWWENSSFTNSPAVRDDSKLGDSPTNGEMVLRFARERSNALVRKDASTLDLILAPEFV
jgi:hypothetical protein